MDWIHCNACYLQPRSNSNPPKLHLTSCGHIFCDRCNQAATSNKCRVCEAQYTTTVLSSQLREEVRDFFANPETLLEKFVKVSQFQNSHRERLLAQCRKTVIKYEAAKKELHKYQEENRNLRKKNHAMQQEIAWYKIQRERARSSRAAPAPPTPGSIPSSSPFIGGMTSSDSQRSTMQRMRDSGMGSSRISMGFTSSTPRRQDLLSPLSMMPPSTPFSAQYRSHHFTTPESTPGNSSFAPPSPASSDGRYGHSSSSQRRPQSPPTRGTPTDALKFLSLAYKNP